MSMSRQFRLPILAASAVLGLSLAGPAHALKDDGSGTPLESLSSLFGLDEKSDDPAIKYRERSPLVLPPNTGALPAPRPPAAKAATNWPQDQEVVRARKKQQETTARVRGEDPDDNLRQRPDQMRNVYAPNPVNGPGAADPCERLDPDNKSCAPGTYWGKLAVSHKPKEEAPTLQAGVEPPREFLTQPPKGYMKPTKNVKATFEVGRRPEEVDPREFYWDQSRKRAE
jgi:hypothetical protein